MFKRGCVSFLRRCPRCRSLSVFKEYRHHYYLCDECRHRFVGFRLGPIRLGIAMPVPRMSATRTSTKTRPPTSSESEDGATLMRNAHHLRCTSEFLDACTDLKLTELRDGLLRERPDDLDLQALSQELEKRQHQTQDARMMGGVPGEAR